MEWQGWIGKRIFVVLRNGLKYSGTVLDANEEFVRIRDIFNADVTFRVSDISLIQEKAEGGYEK